MSDQTTAKLIRRTVLALLARRDYSSQELIKKLQTKGYTLANIEDVMSDLARVNLVNDKRYTESLVESHRQKGFGPRRIEQELKKRGIEKELIEIHLNDHDPIWLIIIQQVWQKRFKGKQPNDPSEYAKQMRFLQYRGFTEDHIRSVLEYLFS